MRAAIYARYSSEHQSDTSIEDQNRKCEQRAARERWKVVERYEDRAISGAKRDRPGYQAMLAGAEARAFDVLLVDSQSRLGRDSVESERAFRRLEHWGIRVICLADGYDSSAPKSARKMQRAVKAMINEAYLDQLATDTHRGVEGRVLGGFSGGGRAYGYTSEPVEDPSRTDRYGRKLILGYRRKVDPKQKPVVLDIFTMFADGMSPKAIARTLNARKVPSPAANWNRVKRDKRADGKWMGSGIYAMLDNEIYVGQIVWNKSRWEKDPEDGRRVRRERPESEWVRHEDKSLRIVPDALWQRVKARQQEVAEQNAVLRTALKNRVIDNGGVAGRKPTNFWSGLLVCGVCGRSFIKISRYNYACGSYANGGEHACGNKHFARASALDDRVLRSIKDELVTPERLKLMERAMRECFEREIQKVRDTRAADRAAARLAAIDREMGNVADAIAQVGLNAKLKEKLDALAAERAELQASVGAEQADPRLLYDIAAALPKLVQRNLDLIASLGSNRRTLNPLLVARAQNAMRRLVGSITLRPQKAGLVAELELTGERVALLAQEAARGARQQKQRAIKLVAGAGFEPATFGL